MEEKQENKEVQKDSIQSIIQKLSESVGESPALVICSDGESVASLINMGTNEQSLIGYMLNIATGLNYHGMNMKILTFKMAIYLSKLDPIFKRELEEAIKEEEEVKEVSTEEVE